MKRSIEINGEQIEYLIERKKIVRAYIRVMKDSSIKVTIPKNCPFNVIDDFVVRHIDWVKKKLSEREKIKSEAVDITGQDKEWILFQGKQYPVQYSLAKKVNIQIAAEVLNMQLTLAPERINFEATIAGWRKFTAKYVYSEILKRLFERVKVFGFEFPNLKVKQMRSRWGSYSRRTHTINMNAELLKAPIECIEFVIMHELCHLKHLDHSKNFYNLLTELMPDHKEREKALKLFFRKWGTN